MPLSYTNIESWKNLYGHCLDPRDVDALLMLDLIVMNQDEKEEAEKPVSAARDHRWPDRAPGVTPVLVSED